MRLPSGRQIRAAMVAEVADILSDLPAISITSGSRDIINSIAFISPCHNSVNALSLREYSQDVGSAPAQGVNSCIPYSLTPYSPMSFCISGEVRKFTRFSAISALTPGFFSGLTAITE